MSQHVTTLQWIADNWIWFVFWGWILGVGTFFKQVLGLLGACLAAVAELPGEISERRHKRRMKELKLQREIAVASQGRTETPTAAAAKPCAHPYQHVEDVWDSDRMNIIARLCTRCDTQLELKED
jgi:hypothetical protein